MEVICENEPFQKLINQGMIQGRSNFVYRIKDTNTFVSLNLKDQYEVTPIHVDVNIVYNDILDVEAFKNWRPEYKNAEFILEDGKYICGWAVEKMSKSMFNVVNPDMIVENTVQIHYVCMKCSGTVGTIQTLGYKRYRRCSSFPEKAMGFILRKYRQPSNNRCRTDN